MKFIQSFVGKNKAVDFRDYSRLIKHRADFAAKKDNLMYIVEVKTNTGRIDTEDEMKDLLRAKEFGFFPMVLRLKVNVQATDFVVEIL